MRRTIDFHSIADWLFKHRGIRRGDVLSEEQIEEALTALGVRKVTVRGVPGYRVQGGYDEDRGWRVVVGEVLDA